jgi:predicted  nucleic acid-binding Zn-ribbon protein
MSSALAACANCGHIFTEQEALDPCPECGGTERTLHRERVMVDRPDDETTVTVRRVEERSPDGSTRIVDEPLDESTSGERDSRGQRRS